MGMYDSIMIECPSCGEPKEAQTKSGDCILEEMTLQEAIEKQSPALADVNRHAPFKCYECGNIFQVDFSGKLTAEVVSLGSFLGDSFDED